MDSGASLHMTEGIESFFDFEQYKRCNMNEIYRMLFFHIIIFFLFPFSFLLLFLSFFFAGTLGDGRAQLGASPDRGAAVDELDPVR